MKLNQLPCITRYLAVVLIVLLLASCGHSRSLSSVLPSGDDGSSGGVASSVPATDWSSAYSSGEMELPVDARYKGPYRLPEGRVVYTQETIDEYPFLKEAGIQPGIYQMDEPLVPAKSANKIDVSDAFDGFVAPSTGTVNVLVLKVDFGGGVAWSNDEINKRLFKPGSSKPGGSMHDYYDAQSHGQLNLIGDIYPTDDSYYFLSGGAHLPLTAAQAGNLLDQAAADGVDFSDYDADHSGKIDALILLCKFYFREFVGPFCSTMYFKRNGVWILRAAFLADEAIENDKFVAFHEYGHIMGLPDYYDYGDDVSDPNPGPDGDESNGNGFWELMAAGNYVYPPQNLSALNKYILNWDTPINVTSNQHDVRILPVESGPGNIYRLWKNGIEGAEYFLIENRGTNGEYLESYVHGDTRFPSQLYVYILYTHPYHKNLRFLPPGLLVWHVDERVYNGYIPGQDVGPWGYGCNDYEEHKFLDLEECTATYQFTYKGSIIVDHNDRAGDVSYSGGTYDPWPQRLNSVDYDQFGPDTTPNSNDYDGELTYVNVSNIHWDGADIVADLIIGGPDIEFDFPSPAVLSSAATLTPSLATNISSAHYYIDDSPVATLDEAPFSYDFDTASYDFAGVHFRAVAENPDVPQDDTFELDLIIDNTDGEFPLVADFDGAAVEMVGTSMPSETYFRLDSDGYDGSAACFGLHRDAGGYDGDLQALAVLPLVDLPEWTVGDDDLSLVFYQHYNLESGADKVSVVVSTDGFASDYTVAETQAGSEAIYSGYREDWQRVHVKLNDWAGQKVHVGFLVTTNGSVYGEEPTKPAGWWVDHIVLATQYTDSVPTVENPGVSAGTVVGVVPELPELSFTPSASGEAVELEYALLLDGAGDIEGSVSEPPFAAAIDVSHLHNQEAVLRLQAINDDGVPGPAVEVPLFIYNLRSDANADGVVDEDDHAAIAAAFGITSSHASYLPWLDTNRDDVVDERDLSSVGYDFGSSM